jgi:hypothetical protein
LIGVDKFFLLQIFLVHTEIQQNLDDRNKKKLKEESNALTDTATNSLFYFTGEQFQWELEIFIDKMEIEEV